MFKSILKWLTGIVILTIFACLALLFIPKNNHHIYLMRVEPGQGTGVVSKKLAADNIIYSRHLLFIGAYLTGRHNQLKSGTYQLPESVSIWHILQRFREGHPNTITVRIIEGLHFAQMRDIINKTADIEHTTSNWSNEKLLQKIDANALSKHPEGLFFPDSYEIDLNGSDLQIYQTAYRTMQKHLQAAWEERQSGLPYKNPYELLIMASLIEKETAHPNDRRHIAAVFINRLNIGMRLQTDPSVIYGMGNRYHGRLSRDDLRRDNPYNTYTRLGLPPTPIALPSKAVLEAAAHPSSEKYLYFVSRMDGSGLSQFSHNLDEHNKAVRQYILKQPQPQSD